MLAAMICGVMFVGCGGGGSKPAATESNQIEVTEIVTKSAEDLMLDEFEQFVDEYIEVLKQAMAGDADAIAKSEELASQYEDLMQRLTEADDEGRFSEEHGERAEKIGEKMAAAFE